MIVKVGDYVLLIYDNRRRWLLKAEEGKKHHTHRGVVDFEDIIGKPYGTTVLSNLNHKFYVVKPTPMDLILKMQRATQIIYPKDIGLILLNTGIGPGSRVVEAGTGSGALTTILANYVKPSGRVYSYESREEFSKIARKNLEKAEVIDYVELKNKDILEGIEEENIDAVVLDMATPWLAVKLAHNALVGGGHFCSYTPTIEQAQKTVKELKNENFIDIRTQECMVRDIIVEEGKTRPETRMIAHTAYITFARKIV
ncbi:MAG: tRNA (adenine-N1)-methyltransferase [Candidatus Jordarchaeum sp.]|uniref:tRNA (adenine-N1)-methyltransferase n=1 Tax=Candidatus Jordarchaeum sp. TaxID=2823881 RepID=UPI00404B09A9